MADVIGHRDDAGLRHLIESYAGELRFEPLEQFGISQTAWDHIAHLQVPPRLVFAHPDLLRDLPLTSLYYRGISLLSQKQVGQLAASVASWENDSLKRPVQTQASSKVAKLYNQVISSIIQRSGGWTLEDGYRNIVATMAITLDGAYRTRIGQEAEQLVKPRIAEWVGNNGLVVNEPSDGVFELIEDVLMTFGAEPDIKFEKNGSLLATVEIKGGKDPAGALERLGAMRKSFAETPPGCANFLVAGVITREMKSRLDQMGVVKLVLLDELNDDQSKWDEFMVELFHHSLRLV